MDNTDQFARWTFLIAGVYGILFLVPGFFLESTMNATDPPAITHPEFYYGFVGSALVWQIVFLVIASDPAKYRTLIAVSVLEKIAFFAAVLALYFTGRLPIGGPFIGGMIDGFWMVMFAVAWLRTKPA